MSIAASRYVGAQGRPTHPTETTSTLAAGLQVRLDHEFLLACPRSAHHLAPHPPGRRRGWALGHGGAAAPACGQRVLRTADGLLLLPEPVDRCAARGPARRIEQGAAAALACAVCRGHLAPAPDGSTGADDAAVVYGRPG